VTLRAGSYNAAKPRWRGIIRNDGAPWYGCWHSDHHTPKEARACADRALPAVKEFVKTDGKTPFPDGWESL
jgi:hypothetical protein